MKIKYPLYVLFAAALAFFLLSCGKKETTETAPATGASAGKTVDVATAGSITGIVRLDGAPPKPRRINMAAEPNCAKQHSEPVLDEQVVTGPGGALANVIIYVKGDLAGYTFQVPTSPMTIDQKGCMYTPHVLALGASQPLQVINSDPTTHNIHPAPKDNREWNESQPPGAAPIEKTFAREEVAIPVKCNVHPWMKAYIAVLNNPYFAVTGKDGKFEIKNLPPGTYTIEAWQELYGTSDQSVTIGPKESKTVEFAFKATSAAGD